MIHRLTPVLLLTLGLAASQAWAHAKPLQEIPAANATVSTPGSINIAFSEGLEPAFSTLAVTDAQGKPVTSAKAGLDGGKHNTLSLTLPPLPAGTYTVSWAAVAVDGHRSHGSYRFTVK